jgi:uncharacterized repeat protein (TIGR03803 family)
MFRFSRAPLLAVSAVLLATGLASAQSFNNLHSFSSSNDGEYPYSGVVLAPDGNFYIAIYGGGSHADGTIVKLTPSGASTVLHDFSGTDGSNPGGNLVVATDGHLYGGTGTGGSGSNPFGTFFSIIPGGAFTSLATFNTATGDTGPHGRIIETAPGTFYGVTFSDGSENDGSVYSATSTGTITSLYNFTGNADEKYPAGGVIQGSDGNFYGTASDYLLDAQGGNGIVYKLTPGGKITVLHTFADSDGQAPSGALVEGADGDFYGTAAYGGTDDYGLIYKISPTGTFSILHIFTHTGTDGAVPSDGIMLASDGNFYGGTAEGGDGDSGKGGGTIFKMTPSGTVTTLYNFCSASSCTDGAAAYAPPDQGTDGSLYGTAAKGGANDEGVFYHLTLSPALPVPVQLSFSPATISLGNSATLTWTIPYAFSKTEQFCFATGQTGAGSWTGVQTGSLTGNNYSGSASITPAATGTYTYSLTCGGHKSGSVSLTVTASSKQSSTTTLTATPNPASVGQTVTLKATVTGSGSTPTGTVAFDYSTITLDTANLSSGATSFAASTNGIGPASYPLTATYSGNSSYDSSTSPALTVKLEKSPTTTALSIDPTTVTPPGTVTLTATVTRPSGSTGKPTGSVTFLADGSALATVSVNASGVAKLTAPTTGTAAGSYSVTAKYSGDSSDTASTSSAVNVTVK